MTNQIQPYKTRKTFSIGDGKTQFTNSQPRTGDEKYQPSLSELMDDISEGIQAAMLTLTQPLGELCKSVTDLMETPEMQQLIHELHCEETLKAAARQRSRDDLRQKRREMMGRKGRR